MKHPIELVLEDAKTAMATENLDGAASGADVPDSRESPMPEIHSRQPVVRGKFRLEQKEGSVIKFANRILVPVDTDELREHIPNPWRRALASGLVGGGLSFLGTEMANLNHHDFGDIVPTALGAAALGGTASAAGGLASGFAHRNHIRQEIARLERPMKTATDLTTEARNELPTGDFALPGRRYPIHDEAHARNALARVAQHGSPAEKSRVRGAVHRKFPGIHEEEKAAMNHIVRFEQIKQAGVGDAVRGAVKSVKQVGKAVGKHFSGGSSGTGLGHVLRAGRKLVGGYAMMHGARRATKALERESPMTAAVHGAGAAVAGHLGGLTNTEKLIAGGIGAYRGHREAKKEKAEKEKKDEGSKESCWATEYFKQAEMIVGGPSQGSRVRDALLAGAGLAGAAGGGLLLGHEIGGHNPLLAGEVEGAMGHGMHNLEDAYGHPGATMHNLGAAAHDSVFPSRDEQPMADMVMPLPAHLQIPAGGHTVSH